MNGRDMEWEAGVRDPLRLAAVGRVPPLGDDPDDAFDRLSELAVALIGAPRACITLVNATHTTAKSLIGFPEGSPRSALIEESFCRYVVASGRPLVVDDANNDPRTAGDPAITLNDAASWAGFPIEDSEGISLGTFCLMDSKPHVWTDTDLHIIATLAKAASTEIALRTLQAETRAIREKLEALRARIARDLSLPETS